MAREEGPQLTALGKLIVFLFIAGCFYGAYYFFMRANPPAHSGQTSSTPTSTPISSNNSSIFSQQAVTAEIGIAYGTEKKNWLEWAVVEFAKTDAGKTIKINLIPMGSLEGGKAAAQGDQRIHVWAPASSVYKGNFLQDWEVKFGNTNAFVKEEIIALTPMVILMWEDRYATFTANYKPITFANIGMALQEPTGWIKIANKPEWGLFKFGHTDPTKSNSGMLTLVLMAYDFHYKCKDLTTADIVNPQFQEWLRNFSKAVTGLSHSTGTMTREMILKGPSIYDAIFVYENTAIDYLKAAQGRWGNLHVIYPERNMWNDNPYYILDAPWSSKEQKQAAEIFLTFLMSEPVQKRALEHGFRPGDPQIAINQADSPFMQYQSAGLQINIDNVCAVPHLEVITNLLNTWQRTRP